jgi:hypothetical protein
MGFNADLIPVLQFFTIYWVTVQVRLVTWDKIRFIVK